MPNENDPSKQGAEGQGAEAQADKQQYFTKDDFAAFLKDELPKALGPVITGHLKKHEKTLDERFKALAPRPAAGEEGGDAGDAGDQAAAKGGAGRAGAAAAKGPEGQALSPELQKIADLEKRLAKTEEANKSAKLEAAKERRQRMEEAGFGSLRSALTGKVAAGAEGLALDVLKARGQVAIGEDGTVRLKLRASADEPEEGLDIDGGIAAFLKSKEAAFLLPAPGTGPAARGPRVPFVPAGGGPARGAAAAGVDLDEAFRARTGKSLAEVLSG
jgi:hypothetical protein